jgi:hypothetical protein
MVPDSLRDRWDGNRWSWWALMAGGLLVLLALVAGLTASLVLPGGWSSLVLSGLLVELIAIGVVGSGMLTGLASRAIAGGMARQPLPEQRRGAHDLTEHERTRRDRRTLRAGVMALPILAAFVILLYV